MVNVKRVAVALEHNYIIGTGCAHRFESVGSKSVHGFRTSVHNAYESFRSYAVSAKIDTDNGFIELQNIVEFVHYRGTCNRLRTHIVKYDRTAFYALAYDFFPIHAETGSFVVPIIYSFTLHFKQIAVYRFKVCGRIAYENVISGNIIFECGESFVVEFIKARCGNYIFSVFVVFSVKT